MIELAGITPLLLLCLAALLAGFVDAISGGGGLVQVPALMSFAPSLPIAAVLGTNKLSSIFGTAAALWRYRTLGLVQIGKWRAGIVAAAIGSFVGAMAATWLNPTVLRPVVIGLTIAVLVYTLLSARLMNSLAPAAKGKLSARPSTLIQTTLGGGMGAYDGFYGPGAGSFLIVGLVRICRLDALRASSAAKTMNLASNAGALSWFLFSGNVSFKVGLAMGALNLLGGLVGSQLAARLGPKLVRALLLLVVSALLIRLFAESI